MLQISTFLVLFALELLKMGPEPIVRNGVLPSYTPINGLKNMDNWGHDPYKLVVNINLAEKPEVGGMAWWDQAQCYVSWRGFGQVPGLLC